MENYLISNKPRLEIKCFKRSPSTIINIDWLTYKEMLVRRSVVLVVSLAILGSINASAVTDNRPDGITGETWQFGPLNRWAYTHIREILPTKNIANDNNLVQPIPGLLDAKDDLSINLGGKTVQLSAAM